MVASIRWYDGYCRYHHFDYWYSRYLAIIQVNNNNISSSSRIGPFGWSLPVTLVTSVWRRVKLIRILVNRRLDSWPSDCESLIILPTYSYLLAAIQFKTHTTFQHSSNSLGLYHKCWRRAVHQIILRHGQNKLLHLWKINFVTRDSMLMFIPCIDVK